jgi:myo-inositol-1(or 4)-monophosphatase
VKNDDLDVALAAAEAGARELTSRYRSAGIRDAATSKGLPRDLVTDADRASEAAVLAVIRRERPGDAIVAEETAARAAPGRRTWIVDPLDGTVNFAHGIPIFCVSVGLVEGGAPVAGVVQAPLLHELFAGAPGRGATLNGAPIRTAATRRLADAILATGFAYDIENLADDNLDNLANVAKKARGIRRLGSAALDLAWVAAGRLDGFWELHLSPWDVAAGAALVRAAGGRVTDMTGGDDWLFGRHLAATCGGFHDELLATLRRPSFAKG